MKKIRALIVGTTVLAIGCSSASIASASEINFHGSPSVFGSDLAKADDLIWQFAAGCAGWRPLEWALNKPKPVAARALTWAVKQALKAAEKLKK
ncbi:hypothetical protein [Cutibacterium sp.]|uniref:hypothetical protein n=1 Tax=Cutibacterium sp. TaxID=1912221 RepID=UPI0026DD0824|nr:hypothetical protein [Cutibacterium sp.]MDO4412285.1 hypothetical protein [Cutibacterium sp.]